MIEEQRLKRNKYQLEWYYKNKEKHFSYQDPIKKKIHDKKWRDKNKEKLRQYRKLTAKQRLTYQKDYRKKRRLMVIKHYGNKCECCNENNIEFLAIDHINGNGRKEYLARGKTHVIDHILKNNYPSGYRILCHNCNMSLGFYGYCPHKKKGKGRERV